MAKKTVKDFKRDIQKLVAEKKLIFGSAMTLKGLKKGTISKLYLAMNCTDEMKEELVHYCSFGNIVCETLPVSNVDLGVLCRKPFPVSVLGQKKE